MVRMLGDEPKFSERFTTLFWLHDPSQGRLGRPALQFQREAAGASSTSVANFGEDGKQEPVIAKVSARGHDRHDALPREPLYEQVSALGYIGIRDRSRGPFRSSFVLVFGNRVS